ncbi:MAG: phosphatase PAP2 family protein [Mesorhizobium sp.]
MTSRSLLHPAESFVLRITAATAAVDTVMILFRGSTVDFPAYGSIAIVAGLMMGVGILYRRSGRSDRIGTTLICAGLFIVFTAALSLFNYCLLPNANPTIDPLLLDLDAALGYSWPDAVTWASNHLAASGFMKLAYVMTLPQIVILMIVLGFTRRFNDLYGLMIAITIAGTFTILFWGLFPTTGPSAYFDLPQNVVALVGPILGPEYGATVTELIRTGTPYLSPDDFRGLVSFPSFHTVLALAITVYVRHVKYLRIVLLPLNLAVIPATLVHGAHHIVDIPGGIVVFLFSAYCAHRMLEGQAASLPVETNAAGIGANRQESRAANKTSVFIGSLLSK